MPSVLPFPDALDDSAEALDEQPGEAPEETYDERGPVCVECGDPLPLGLAGTRCDECVEPDEQLAALF